MISDLNESLGSRQFLNVANVASLLGQIFVLRTSNFRGATISR